MFFIMDSNLLWILYAITRPDFHLMSGTRISEALRLCSLKDVFARLWYKACSKFSECNWQPKIWDWYLESTVRKYAWSSSDLRTAFNLLLPNHFSCHWILLMILWLPIYSCEIIFLNIYIVNKAYFLF